MNKLSMRSALFALSCLLLAAGQSRAQIVVQDDFNTGMSTNSWTALGGACLTASAYGANAGSSIPGCVGLPYYQGKTMVGNLPDASGSGALRMTDGYPNGYNQAGAIISNFTFPNDSGVQVTFTTISYHGDSGGSGHDGADGMSFFLMNGANSPYDVGAYGGSLGYTCSNANDDTGHPRAIDGTRRGYDGLAGGYLGLGIDEYGNFLNAGDNTNSGFGYVPNRIGLRGAGSVTWAALQAAYPTYYPSWMYTTQYNGKYLSDIAVQQACSTGYVYDYSAWATNGSAVKKTAIADYTALPGAYSLLPNGVQIANESATTRSSATPITYKLKITSNGLLSFSYSVNGGAYQSVLNGQNITTSNGALPPTFRFGFAGSTGGSTNVHEILCFQAAPADTASSSAGLNQVQSSKLEAGAQVYFAYYNPTTYAGYLTATSLYIDSTTKLVTVAPVANWDASCVLTGVASGALCANTGVAGPTAAQTPSSRTILTWNPSANTGAAFEWTSLTTAQQNALDAGDGSATQNRLQFLRGDRSNEVSAIGVGLYRDRSSVLGDIIDSSPTWVGPPVFPYNTSWQDKLYTSATPNEGSGQAYSTFVSTYNTRQNVVYIGANDSMIHGFRAGGYDSSGNFVANSTTPNDGSEVLAFVPAGVLATIHDPVNASNDYSNPQYGHEFDIDATPGTGDLYYSGAWHTWLVGGLGPGGAEVFALDITNPSAFAESGAASTVIGDWTNTTITCANVSGCGANMGNTYGTPQIRRFHNGQWGVVFGNGFGSSTGNAGIFIMLVSPSGGAPTFYYLQAPAGASNNGIAYVSPVDLDGDHITDYIYAGDLAGNVWRFDVTSNVPGNWASSATALFTTPTGQPITTKLMVASVPSANTAPRLIVAFGTGQQQPITNSTPATFAAGQQSLYGIWDWNLSAWNLKSLVQYASLAGPQTVTPAKLQTQYVTGTFAPQSGDVIALGYRTVSTAIVCWSGTAGCTGTAAQFGWSMALPGNNEQIIYSPTLINGVFVVNTIIPANGSAVNCQPTTPTVSGEQLNGTGTPSLVNSNTIVTQTSNGTPKATPYNPGTSVVGKRLTWIQKR